MIVSSTGATRLAPTSFFFLSSEWIHWIVKFNNLFLEIRIQIFTVVFFFTIHIRYLFLYYMHSLILSRYSGLLIGLFIFSKFKFENSIYIANSAVRWTVVYIGLCLNHA
jgi:hypothetical protein